MFTLVNDLSAAQFVTINVDLTVTLNDTWHMRRHKSSKLDPVGRGGETQGVCVQEYFY